MSKPKFRKTVVYVAFNPDTGYAMWPTAFLYRNRAIIERDKYYEGCPVIKCELRPLKQRRKESQ